MKLQVGDLNAYGRLARPLADAFTPKPSCRTECDDAVMSRSMKALLNERDEKEIRDVGIRCAFCGFKYHNVYWGGG